MVCTEWCVNTTFSRKRRAIPLPLYAGLGDYGGDYGGLGGFTGLEIRNGEKWVNEN